MQYKKHNTGAVSLPLILIGLIVVAILVTVFVLNQQAAQQTETENVPEAAPDFTLQDYNGNTVSLSDSHGKVRILNSWATWCPFCVNELPDFATLQEEFADEIVVIAINREESLEQSQSYIDDLGIADKLTFLLDPEDSFYRAAGGFGMPVTVFVDAEGNKIRTKRGPLTLEQMREEIQSILSGQS